MTLIWPSTTTLALHLRYHLPSTSLRFVQFLYSTSSMSTQSNPVISSSSSTEINTAPDITLSSHQKSLIQSVLDLFQGKATKQKLALWTDDAIFEDPICIAYCTSKV